MQHNVRKKQLTAGALAAGCFFAYDVKKQEEQIAEKIKSEDRTWNHLSK